MSYSDYTNGPFSVQRGTIKKSDYNLRSTGELIWKDFLEANNECDPPLFYLSSGGVCTVRRHDEGGGEIQVVHKTKMRHVIAGLAEWIQYGPQGEIKKWDPPPELADDMLAVPHNQLPWLRRISCAPFFDAAGNLCARPGYYKSSGCLYIEPKNFKPVEVDEEPIDFYVEIARDLICKQLFGDFPFVDDSSRAHAVALLLLPFVRDMIDGPTPLHLWEKPTRGTGATLGAQVAMIPALGSGPMSMSSPEGEAEWLRTLHSALQSSPPAVLIDNAIELTSLALSSAISGENLAARVIGASTMTAPKVNCVWIATANNPVLNQDIDRRTVRIRLDTGTEKPELGRVFKYPNLARWVMENRNQLIWAALTLVQAWKAAGHPKRSWDMCGFSTWAEMIGGILEVAGIPGFLGNLRSAYNIADPNTANTETFLHAWHSEFGSEPVRAAQLLPHSEIVFGSAKGRNSAQELGMHLYRIRDKVYGAYQVRHAPERAGNARMWQVLRTNCK